MSAVTPLELYLIEAPFDKTNLIYRSCYHLWNQVWGRAFEEEFNLGGQLRSDGFSKHDVILALFQSGNCVALVAFQYFDLENECDMNNSYFDSWPGDVIKRLRFYGQTIAACTNLTIDPMFRRINMSHFKYLNDHLYDPTVEFKSREVILSVVNYLIQDTHFDSILATPRIERNINTSTYNTGALKFLENIPYKIKGQSIDLVAWVKKELGKISNEQLAEVGKILWLSKTVISPRQNIKYGEKNVQRNLRLRNQINV